MKTGPIIIPRWDPETKGNTFSRVFYILNVSMYFPNVSMYFPWFYSLCLWFNRRTSSIKKLVKNGGYYTQSKSLPLKSVSSFLFSFVRKIWVSLGSEQKKRALFYLFLVYTHGLLVLFYWIFHLMKTTRLMGAGIIYLDFFFFEKKYIFGLDLPKYI